MDASHLLSLIRNPNPAPAAATISPAAKESDLDRLFKVFANPHVASSSASSVGYTPIDRIVHSGEVSSRQSPVSANASFGSIGESNGVSNGASAGLASSSSAHAISSDSNSSTGGAERAEEAALRTISPDLVPLPPRAAVADARSLLDRLMGPTSSSSLPPVVSASFQSSAVAESSVPAIFESATDVSQLSHMSPTLASAVVVAGVDAGIEDGASKVANTEMASEAADWEEIYDDKDAEQAAPVASIEGVKKKKQRTKRAEKIPQPEIKAEEDASAPSTSAQSPFTFVSPFDLLARAQVQTESDAEKSASAESTPTAVVPTERSTLTKVKREAMSIALPPSIPSTPPIVETPIISAQTTAPVSSLPSGDSYLARNHLDLAPESSSTSNGITLARKAAKIDRLTIDVAQRHVESIYRDPVTVTPITLFKNEVKWEMGRRLAAWENGICYVTKQGKIRIIDRASGARLLLKGHSGPLLDIAVSPLCSASISGEQATRIIISVGSDKKTIFWRIPDQFAEETAEYEEMRELVAPSSNTSTLLVRFSPEFVKTSLVAFARSDGRVEEYTLGQLEVLKSHWTASKVSEAAQAKSIVDFCYSPDGTLLATLTADGQHSLRSARSHAGPTYSKVSAIPTSLTSASQIALSIICDVF